MFIFIILIFNIFSPSFQIVHAKFYCEDEVQQIYLEDPVTKKLKYLRYGPSDGNWRTPSDIPDLAADPGDTIIFKCYSHLDVADCWGGGCFLINNNCHCYNFYFESTAYTPYEPYTFTTDIEGRPCILSVL